jgi:hypothetical protein
MLLELGRVVVHVDCVGGRLIQAAIPPYLILLKWQILWKIIGVSGI